MKSHVLQIKQTDLDRLEPESFTQWCDSTKHYTTTLLWGLSLVSLVFFFGFKIFQTLKLYVVCLAEPRRWTVLNHESHTLMYRAAPIQQWIKPLWGNWKGGDGGSIIWLLSDPSDNKHFFLDCYTEIFSHLHAGSLELSQWHWVLSHISYQELLSQIAPFVLKASSWRFLKKVYCPIGNLQCCRAFCVAFPIMSPPFIHTLVSIDVQ